MTGLLASSQFGCTYNERILNSYALPLIPSRRKKKEKISHEDDFRMKYQANKSQSGAGNALILTMIENMGVQ